MHAATISSRSYEEARRALEATFPGSSITEGDEEVRFAMRSWSLPELSAQELGLQSAGVTATVDLETRFVMVRADWRQGALVDRFGPVDTSGPFLWPERSVATVGLVTMRSIAVDGRAAEAYARRALGRDDFRLVARGTKSLQADAGERWGRLAAFVLSAVRGTESESPLVVNQLFELVAASLLEMFPTSWLGASESADAAGTAAVRRARDFMEEHAAEPIGVADAAAAARLSLRGLEAAFSRELGTTPSRYLRRVRLEAAHRDLLGADGDGITVGAVAQRWGFVNRGRFAAEHRAAFGEGPSATLRKS